MRRCWLGVDGGGTKTRFLLVDASATPLAEAELGTTWFPQVGLEGAHEVLAQGVAQVLAAAGRDAADITYAFFGLPAYGENRAITGQLDALPATILGHGRYRCDNDMVCGWAGSLACADGINLVAGTGSIGYGQRQGCGARAGGWGSTFGDDGSSHWIALQGLNVFSKMSDGRLPKGPLHAIVRQALALEHDLDLCAHIYGEHAATRTELARMAHWVADAARAGDGAALRIYADAGHALAQLAVALRHSLGFADDAPVPVSYSGGAFHAGDLLLAPLRAALAEASDRFRLQEPQHAPHVGAALYAMRLAAA